MIPCALSSRERDALQRWADGKRVIEAGALLGGSTIILASTAAHIISIDKHEGYSAPTERQFRSNLQRYRVNEKVQVVVADCATALPHYTGDVGFIDLDGTFTTTQKAIQAIRTPIVMVHDLGRSRCSGVERAIHANQLDIIEHIDTLAVCRKRLPMQAASTIRPHFRPQARELLQALGALFSEPSRFQTRDPLGALTDAGNAVPVLHPKATSWSLHAAIGKVAFEKWHTAEWKLGLLHDLETALDRHVRELDPREITLMGWASRSWRTHRDVLELLDRLRMELADDVELPFDDTSRTSRNPLAA